MAWCDCENCAKIFACTKLVGIRFGGCATDNEPKQEQEVQDNERDS